MFDYDWVDKNYLKDAEFKDFKDYTFNIVFDLDAKFIEMYKKEILKFDNKYHVEINNDILNPKKQGFFKPKEKTIYDIMKDNLELNDSTMDNIVCAQLKQLNLENLIYRQPKALSTRQKMAISMVIDAYQNKNYYLVTDEMFVNKNNLCKMLSWLLKRAENNNGSIVWLTEKSIDEVDDVCDLGIKYPSKTCFYYRGKSYLGIDQLMKTDQRRKQQSFNVDIKEKNFVFDKKTYSCNMSVSTKNDTIQELTFLKYYLKRYDLDLIDLFLAEINGRPKLHIGIVGKDSFLALYDITIFLKVANMYAKESDYEDFVKEVSITEIFYVETQSSEVIFFDLDAREAITFDETYVPFSSEELSEIKVFSMVEYKGGFIGLYKEIDSDSVKEWEIESGYKEYKEKYLNHD